MEIRKTVAKTERKLLLDAEREELEEKFKQNKTEKKEDNYL